ncbi:cell adhesion molecule CEACAM21-like [Ctenodactylus gundi]
MAKLTQLREERARPLVDDSCQKRKRLKRETVRLTLDKGQCIEKMEEVKVQGEGADISGLVEVAQPRARKDSTADLPQQQKLFPTAEDRAAADTMEPLSTFPRRGHVSWQEIVLTVLLLTIWTPPISAKLSIELPLNAVKGSDVLLAVHDLPQDILGFQWFKGKQAIQKHRIGTYLTDRQEVIPGPEDSGQVTIYPNGSLLLHKVKPGDTGDYTLQAINRKIQFHQASGQVHVYELLSQPSIKATNDVVTEGSSVVLTCQSRDTGISTRWLFNGQNLQLTRRTKLSQDLSTLTIRPIRREDAGEYQCEVSNPVSSSRSDSIKLAVK